ncbi:ATP-binding protein [Clostridium faecium]|uniref:DUF87 domain-containing protein n=1 Tax=Clostridium faecium TaxID=2762223 RepID=A0ABR8YNM3_9CLOT|nr:ATP-binding protein [Clostridium faecium]MBD8045854.1 DUF87 domain-containing protein [Clostridium faecium]
MNTIQSLLQQGSNIAIIGEAASGKSTLLKSILNNLNFNNKKVLILDNKKEYKQSTLDLDGSYITYDDINNVRYNNKLTTISFSIEDDRPGIELILSLIKKAENEGVEVILIDEAHNYLKECQKLISNVNAQLILSSQFDPCILGGECALNKENVINFKNLFNILILMGTHNYNIQTWPKLLSLYNIDKLTIEELKSQQCYKNIVIQDKKIIEENFKVPNTMKF